MKPERVLELWSTCSDDPVFFADLIEAALMEGKCLVPVEPTEEMTLAAIRGTKHWVSTELLVDCYKAMIQAAKGGE